MHHDATIHDDDHHDAHARESHESGPHPDPVYILSGMAIIAGLFNLPPGFITGEEESWQERFFHYVEPTGEYFPVITHGTPELQPGDLRDARRAHRHRGVVLLLLRAGERPEPAATELANGLTSTQPRSPRPATPLLVNKYYLDHLYTDIIVGGTKGPIAEARVLGQSERHRPRSSTRPANAPCRPPTSCTTRSTRARRRRGQPVGYDLGGPRRGQPRLLQRGKVQQYAAIMFAAATVLGLFMVFI